MSLALSETPKTGFLVSQPTCSMHTGFHLSGMGEYILSDFSYCVVVVVVIERFIQASLRKFKDFSRTSKRLSYYFQGLQTYEKY